MKITSDGTRGGTRIFDADTGDTLEGLRVYGIHWFLDTDGGELPVCVLTCRSTEVELEGDAAVALTERRPDAKVIDCRGMTEAEAHAHVNPAGGGGRNR